MLIKENTLLSVLQYGALSCTVVRLAQQNAKAVGVTATAQMDKQIDIYLEKKAILCRQIICKLLPSLTC